MISNLYFTRAIGKMYITKYRKDFCIYNPIITLTLLTLTIQSLHVRSGRQIPGDEMEQDGKTKEELLDGLLTSGVLTCDEYAKKLRIVQRGASSSEASKEPPANQNANFKTQSPNRPSETLPQRSLHGLAQRELEKRSHAVDAAIRKERQAAMKRPLETLRQVNLELR